MPLPNLEKIVPHFEIIIPSTGQGIQFRPFLVKEEKLLLIALEGEDERQMLDAIVQVVTSCALSPIKVEELANFDLEFIFLQLRSRSVDSNVELSYRCHNKVTLTPEEAEKRRIFKKSNDDPDAPIIADCDHVVKVKINLDDVRIQFNEDHQKQIFLTETLGVNMRYPNFKMARQLLRATGAVVTPKDNVNDALITIALCIESVFDEESVYNNFTTKDIQEWVEKLTQAQFVKLQKFFESIPKLAHDTQFHCSKCGYEEPLHIEGLPSFFG
jgi:hypothetical protein